MQLPPHGQRPRRPGPWDSLDDPSGPPTPRGPSRGTIRRRGAPTPPWTLAGVVPLTEGPGNPDPFLVGTSRGTPVPPEYFLGLRMFGVPGRPDDSGTAQRPRASWETPWEPGTLRELHLSSLLNLAGNHTGNKGEMGILKKVTKGRESRRVRQIFLRVTHPSPPR